MVGAFGSISITRKLGMPPKMSAWPLVVIPVFFLAPLLTPLPPPPGLGSGVEKGTQKAITPTFSWVQMASIPYANSGGGEGGHNEQRPSSSDRRKPPSLL